MPETNKHPPWRLLSLLSVPLAFLLLSALTSPTPTTLLSIPTSFYPASADAAASADVLGTFSFDLCSRPGAGDDAAAAVPAGAANATRPIPPRRPPWLLFLLGHVRTFNVTSRFLAEAMRRSSGRLGLPRAVVVATHPTIQHGDVAWWQAGNASSRRAESTQAYLGEMSERLGRGGAAASADGDRGGGGSGSGSEGVAAGCSPVLARVVNVTANLPPELQPSLRTHSGVSGTSTNVIDKGAQSLYFRKLSLTKLLLISAAAEHAIGSPSLSPTHAEDGDRDSTMVVVARPDLYPESLSGLAHLRPHFERNPDLAVLEFDEVWGLYDTVLVTTLGVVRRLSRILSLNASLTTCTGSPQPESEIALRCLLETACADVRVDRNWAPWHIVRFGHEPDRPRVRERDEDKPELVTLEEAMRVEGGVGVPNATRGWLHYSEDRFQELFEEGGRERCERWRSDRRRRTHGASSMSLPLR